MRNRDVRRSGRAAWPLAVAAIGTFLWVGTAAAPAHADSNFRRGFEDQMGRILAFEAVNVGKAILFQGVVHPGLHGGGYGHGYGPGYAPAPTAYPNVVPIYTHDHGKRPVRWSGYRDDPPGRRLGHFKHRDKHRDKHWGRYDRHDRHRGDCRH